MKGRGNRRGARREEGDEDSDNGGPSRRVPRLVGIGEDEDNLASDDDDEIDSDDAFGESDEERFAGYSFRRKVSG